MDRSKSILVSQQKNVLSIERTLTRFSTCDLKFPKLSHQKSTLLSCQNLQSSNQSVKVTQSKVSNNDNNRLEPVQKKTQHDLKKNRQIFKSLDVKNLYKKTTLQNRSACKFKVSINNNSFKNQNGMQSSKKLSLHQKNQVQKGPIKILELLKFAKKKHLNLNKQQIIERQQIIQKKQKKNLEKQKNGDRSKSKNKDYLKKLTLKQKKSSSFHSFKFLEYSTDSIHEPNSTREDSNLGKLAIQSRLNQVIIDLSRQKPQTVDMESQTFQTQSQFFEYLIYKRKKQKFQNELSDLIKQLQIVKKDRRQFEQRTLLVGNCSYGVPSDQRQKRIYHLKQEMNMYQNQLASKINLKFQTEDKLLQQIQQIQFLTITGINQFDNIIKSYFKLFKQAFQKNSDQKYARMAERLQGLSSNFLADLQSKVQIHLISDRISDQQNQGREGSYNRAEGIF